jgi:hypothetical protein
MCTAVFPSSHRSDTLYRRAYIRPGPVKIQYEKKVKCPGVRPHGATESDQTEETCIPSFLAIVSIYAASMHEYQSFDHVLKVRSLTCAIAECPVLGE